MAENGGALVKRTVLTGIACALSSGASRGVPNQPHRITPVFRDA